MTGPDRVDLRNVPSEEGVTPTHDTAFSDPNVLAAIKCSMHIQPGEAEKRVLLLGSISVDNNGVAHSLDQATGVETLLAAVAIDAQKTATLVALETGPDDALHLPVSTETPTRFGFFVGHKTTGDISLAFRMGLYPGLPLVTQSVDDSQNKEVFIGLRGIKSDEVDEQRWAEQIGLHDKLGFRIHTRRGVFNRFHRPNSRSDQWTAYPMVALPDQILDLLKHYDPARISINTFQMLFYATRDKIETVTPPVPYNNRYLNLGGETLRSYRGVGVGFGEGVSTQAKVTGIDVESLAGAFQVVVIPR